MSVCCSLYDFLVCCLLFVVGCWLLFAVCCLMLALSYFVFAVLVDVAGLFDDRRVSCVVRCLLFVD